ncbi:MAG: alpha/beta hydrolase [Planctomycetaceae bacterium]|nr:alpha/beta hydrolase [Planctomycetaceae bacterium]
MQLDPDADMLLRALREQPPLPLWMLTPEQIRAGVGAIPVPPLELAAVDEVSIAAEGRQIALRVYEPPGDTPVGTVLFFHGGGWVMGSLDSHDALARQLCASSRQRVVAVEYRLAPEHPFPAAQDDAWEALHWGASRYAGPIAVSGDSAGGNLAATLCLRARDQGGPTITAQALIYPVTDARCESESYRANLGQEMLSRESMQWFWNQYCPDPELALSPLASPALADLTALPPALVLAAECDVLRDEVLAYGDQLEAAGVSVTRLFAAGLIHGFMRRLHHFRRARGFCDEIGEFLQRQLSGGAC